MKVVSVINYKGGVGKTTLVANLGAVLAARGANVLLIDCDPQISLTLSFFSITEWEETLRDRRTLRSWLDFAGTTTSPSLAEFVATPQRASRALAGRGRLDLIASHFDLMNEDVRLIGQMSYARGVLGLKKDRLALYRRLAQALSEPDLDDYDYVIVDCPPNFNIATRLALLASSYAVVPARADYLSTIGLRHLLASYARIVRDYNGDVADVGPYLDATPIAPIVLGLVFTMVQFREGRLLKLQDLAVSQARQEFPVFASMMRLNNSLYGYSPEHGVPVALAGHPHPDLAEDLDGIADEFVKRISNSEGVRL